MTSLLLSLVFTAVGFYVLYFVVRAAVRHGMQDALRRDLLHQVGRERVEDGRDRPLQM